MLTGEPWVRCPPAARSRPMKVSPGCSSARNTAWFIWLPEFGCTLAKSAPNSFLARSIASVLGDIDELAAAVIALARIAFGIFVGHHRALRFQHGAADDVFRGDQLDLMALAAEFALDRGGDLRIGLGERGGEERVGRGTGPSAAGGRAHQGEISPPPQPVSELRSVMCGGRSELAGYHIGPKWPSTCGTGPPFMQDMVGGWPIVTSGAMRSIEPGILRFRVWC